MVVRQISSDEWPLWRDLRLRALADAPEAFGSVLADWQGTGDREERWRSRLDDVGYNAVATREEVPAGMVSGVLGDRRVELVSMWVAPEARGRGVGDELIDAVVRWANAHDAAEVELGVKEGNTHAIALYARHGFVDCGLLEREDNLGTPERLMVRR